MDETAGGACLGRVGRIDLLDDDPEALLEIGDLSLDRAATTVGQQPVHPAREIAAAEVELLQNDATRSMECYEPVEPAIDLRVDKAADPRDQILVDA